MVAFANQIRRRRRRAGRSRSPAEQPDVYVWNGATYDWYDDGWNGPGFYIAGFAFRAGQGWGGGEGWRGWRRHAYPGGHPGGPPRLGPFHPHLEASHPHPGPFHPILVHHASDHRASFHPASHFVRASHPGGGHHAAGGHSAIRRRR